jgi:benzoylformate decarboxylase
VYSEPLNDAVNFPATHPLSAGMMAPANAAIRGQLSNHDVVLVVGAVAFMPYPYTPVGAVPPDVELIQIDPDPYEIGRIYPVAVGMVGSVKATLAALAHQLDGRVVAAGERLARARARKDAAGRDFDDMARSRYGPAPIDPMAAAHGLVRGLPAGGIVVDEAVTTGVYVRNFLAADEAGRYHFTIGGGLGWALGAAIGMKLAGPDAPVMAVLGDGSTMYACQGLWSAARYDVPVVFAVVNNSEYRILKQGLDGLSGLSAKQNTYVGMDLSPPAIDFVALARSLGVSAERVEAAADITDAVAAAFESGRPHLLEVPIKGMA